MSHGQSPTKSARSGIFAIPLLAFFLFYGVVLGVVLPSPDEPPEEPPELLPGSLSPPEVSVCDLLSVMVPSTVGLTLPSLVEPSLVLPEDVCTLHTVFNASSVIRYGPSSVSAVPPMMNTVGTRFSAGQYSSGDLTGGRADV